MAWKEYVEHLNKRFTGRKILYEGDEYTITHVDYNGVVHINKPSEHNDTTAVDIEPFKRITIL